MSFPTLDRQKQCSKLNEKITEMNKHQAVTRGHKTLGGYVVIGASALASKFIVP